MTPAEQAEVREMVISLKLSCYCANFKRPLVCPPCQAADLLERMAAHTQEE